MRTKHLFTKLTALTLSVVLILSGCHNSRFDRFSENETKEPSGITSDISKYNPKDKTFTDSEKAVQRDFDDFLTELYVESMSYSMVSTHFDLANPEAFGITEYESIWGDYSAESFDSADDDDKELYNDLLSYDYSALTYEQQLTFDTLKAYLENCETIDKYYYFSEPLSPASGIQFQLPLILSEYAIYDEDDIKDYLTVLSTCDDYINSILEYEKWRAGKGYALTDASMDEAISQCEDILSAPEPAFLSVICDTVDECDFLTSDAKEGYKTQIRQLAADNFVPAIQSIIDTLNDLKGSRTVDGGLCQYDGGKKYYEDLVRLYTGSSKTVDELITIVETDIYGCISRVQRLYKSNPDLYNQMMGELEYIYSEPDDIISYQMSALLEDFPEPACTDFTVKYVAESMESSSNPAYYIIPPYDNFKRNIIYVNGSEEYAHMDLFPTLAHEGVPGHMYQNNYFLSLNPNPVRTLIQFNGYAEGWAKYVEHYSYDWSGLDETVGEALAIDDAFGFALYSRIDIGVNYEGWQLDDVKDFISKYGIDSSFASELYETFINDPATYLQYYFGRLEIEELRSEASDLLKSDFDIKEFHRFILETGPTYFDIILDRMHMWIEAQ